MDENVLAGIPSEGTKPEDENQDGQVTETPAASPAEEEPVEPAPPSEGANTPDETNLPFHKHPRWKEMHEENRRLKETVDQLARTTNELQTRVQQPSHPGQQVPEVFIKAFGDNPEAWNAWQELSKAERAAIKQELIDEQRQQVEELRAKEERWSRWVDESLKSVEDSHSVDFSKNESLKNSFLKFVMDCLPTDAQGNVDLMKGWELFSKLNPPDEKRSQARKSVASKVGTDTKTEGKPRDYLTSHDLRHRDWKSLIK